MDKTANRPPVDDYERLGRREVLRLWGPAALAATALGALGFGLAGRSGRHHVAAAGPTETLPDRRSDPAASGELALATGAGPRANLERALHAIGGLGRFVRPGERVAIKPNVAWDRSPAQAANTDPDLVAALVRLCLEAGAAAVWVVDNTCHDPQRAFARSGIAAAATAAGAQVFHQGTCGTTVRDLGGIALGSWRVLQPLVDADRLINVPVVKHHSLARATVGMKNWIGAVVGRRASLHQRLPQVSAELAAAFKPTLTVVDATRILTGGGPTGGSLQLVAHPDSIAVATDPVAADAWGGSLLGLAPRDLPHIGIAQRLGLGTADWQSVLAEG